MSISSQRPVCADCGLPLPGGELNAHCPHCLLHLALEQDLEAALEGGRGGGAGARARYFGDFELMEEIAQGGMGVVWKARQLTLNRHVALKMIHAGHLASAEARVRFATEIEATARLDHPNIVPLLGTGEYDGIHYYTMRLLAGGDLARRKPDFVLPAADAPGIPPREWRERQVRIAGLATKIARAVHYAHLRGILHRDIKPSNVLLDEEGEPHVGDFGLAKTLARESAFTLTQAVLGSPNYMAPEQALGGAGGLTTATDVYGVGAILYELLTGRPPFQAESPLATLRKVIDDSPVAPRSINPAIDPDLETICLKCLEKLPAARYGSADALADDLGRWIERRPILARRATALEHAWRWCQRETALATALAAAFLLLVAVAVGSSVAAIRIGRAERAAQAALREAQVSQARSLRLSSGLGHRAEGLQLLRDAMRGGVPEGLRTRARDEMLATLVRTDLEFFPFRVPGAPRDPTQNLIAPRFDAMASLLPSNRVVVHAIPSGKPMHEFVLGKGGGFRLEQFSSDGRFLGIRDPEGIAIREVATGRELWRTNGPERVFSFAPDRPEVVVEEWNYSASLLSLPDLRLIRTVHGTSPSASGRGSGWSTMALSPGSRMLVVGRTRDRVTEWIDVERDEVVRGLTNRAPAVALAWSPDGERIAIALSNGRVPVYNARGGGVFNLASMVSVARSLAFSPDGTLLAAQGQDRILRLIDTEALREVFEAPCDAGVVAFDPAGGRLGPIFRGDEAGWLEMRQPSEFRHMTVARTSVEFTGCRHSPDGRFVLVGTSTDVVVCDGAGRRRIGARSGWRFNATAFDPEVRHVYASTPAGVLRWNVPDGDAEGFQIDGMVPVIPGRGWRSIAFAPDGSRFMAANIHSNAAFVFDRTLTNLVARVGPHEAPDSVAISQDGRWAATGSSTDRKVRVWDLANGREVVVLAGGTEPEAVFSPDSAWMASFGDVFTLRRTGQWDVAVPLELGPFPPQLGAAAFSPDGKMLAVVCNRLGIQLIDLATLRSVGFLQAPGTAALSAVEFSPDGARLVGTGSLGRVQFWDLAALRARLHQDSLDWDWP